MNLFQISNEYQKALDDTFDQDTGEIKHNAIETVELMKHTVEEKRIAVASYIKNLDAERKAIEEAKNSMAEREKSLERRVEWLTNYLQANMERCGISEIKSPYFSIKLKKCPASVDIQNENIIPQDYKKVKETVSIDKLKIKEEILAGVLVPGATLKQNNRLEIR